MYVWIPNEVRIWGARRFYFVWALLFRDNVQTHLGGASIREGASNRDITVCGYFSVHLYYETCSESPYNGAFGPGKVIEKSLVSIHQNT